MRVGPSVVTLDAGCENPRRLPGRAADAAPTEANTSAAASAVLILLIIINLLIVGWFCKVSSDEPKLRPERRYFQYRLVLGMILQAD